MRYIAALALLLAPGITFADWTDQDRLQHYSYCREAGGAETLCACAILTLEEIQPDPEKLTGDNVKEAVRACVLPPNTKDTVSI